jgi:mRNA interferase MazF
MAGTLIQRGDIVIVAMQGDYGKPRPALVVQSDLFSPLPSMTVCPITSLLREDADLIRITIEPNDENALRWTSQIMIDKITSITKEKIDRVAGRADGTVMLRVNRALALFLGVA